MYVHLGTDFENGLLTVVRVVGHLLLRMYRVHAMYAAWTLQHGLYTWTLHISVESMQIASTIQNAFDPGFVLCHLFRLLKLAHTVVGHLCKHVGALTDTVENRVHALRH
jgi:hypothetical protein